MNMKINKKIFAGMVVLTLLFGVTLVGCISVTPVTYVETEVSKEIYGAATGLVASKEGGIAVNELMAGLGDKFPGLTLESVEGGAISFEYQGKKYHIIVSYSGAALIRVVDSSSIVEEVFSVEQKE